LSNRILTEIWIYPVKSLPGIRLSKATVMGKGLRYDRRWMLVDENGRFLTQREHPEMALFKISMTPTGFQIESQHNKAKQSAIMLPFENKTSTKPLQVQIWDDEVLAEEVDPTLSSWFSECLTFTCRLVFFPENNTRPVDTTYAKLNEQVSFADAFPYLIIGESSLSDLNGKLEQPIRMNRFRPNFVFTGETAFEEDHWSIIKIGSILFFVAKPCARCVLITVDPETGIKGAEPLKTLSQYRKANAKVLFGQNVISLSQGEIKEGDMIEIIDFK
jgi:uncharacterized protein